MLKIDFLKNNYNVISTSLFIAIIVIAHIFSSYPYNWTKNTISDLGSQGYDKKIIMQLGFLTFGFTLSAGIILSGLTWRTTPILIYAICIALTGIFCTKPFIDQDNYSITQSTLHSTFAQIAGITFSIGILIQLFFTKNNNLNYTHIAFFILVIGLSVTFGILKNYQGIVQRLLYLTSFVWLIKFYKA